MVGSYEFFALSNEKIMRPVIVTGFNKNINIDIIFYQKEVINKLRKNIPFFSYDYSGSDMLHGDVCNKLIHKLFYEYQETANSILILDVDCIPLSSEAIEWTFHQAYSGKLVGNIQRSNHYENEQHVYVAPSYLCITKETYEKAMSPTMAYSNKYDCGELLTINCEKNNIPIEFCMPVQSDSLNYEDKLWDLADGMPKYGIGTTFSNGRNLISYHLFCSTFNKYNHFFVNKCKEIL